VWTSVAALLWQSQATTTTPTTPSPSPPTPSLSFYSNCTQDILGVDFSGSSFVAVSGHSRTFHALTDVPPPLHLFNLHTGRLGCGLQWQHFCGSIRPRRPPQPHAPHPEGSSVNAVSGCCHQPARRVSPGGAAGHSHGAPHNRCVGTHDKSNVCWNTG
jgi:hypothetical protein